MNFDTQINISLLPFCPFVSLFFVFLSQAIKVCLYQNISNKQMFGSFYIRNGYNKLSDTKGHSAFKDNATIELCHVQSHHTEVFLKRNYLNKLST